MVNNTLRWMEFFMKLLKENHRKSKGKGMDKIGWKVRNIIYIVGITAFLVGIAYKCSGRSEASEKKSSEETSDFWPPDMVPHPMPPWERPSSPSGPVIHDKDNGPRNSSDIDR